MITKEDIVSVKERGFLRNRGTDCFSGRLVSAGGVYTTETLKAIAECSEKFGNGKVGFTSRLSAEIVGIPFEKIPEAEAFMAERGLYFGGTGKKIRPITACKGTTCVFGLIDTQNLAAIIHERFYVGMASVKLPHKFKIGVGGCPNSCMKPSLNDVGIEGCRATAESGEKINACKVYVGGTWGKTQRTGTQLTNTYSEDEVLTVIEKIMLWYKENGYSKERLGAAIDRIGIESLEAAIENNDIINRKEAIISAPILER